MIVSTRGRYALQVMIDLAEHENGSYIPMKDVAKRQGLSLKYLEKILPALSKNGLIDCIHGRGGGYRLTRPPENYKVGEILRLTEGDLAPVSCLECGAEPCEHITECRTIPMWSRLNDLLINFFDSITVADLMRGGEDAVCGEKTQKGSCCRR